MWIAGADAEHAAGVEPLPLQIWCHRGGGFLAYFFFFATLQISAVQIDNAWHWLLAGQVQVNLVSSYSSFTPGSTTGARSGGLATSPWTRKTQAAPPHHPQRASHRVLKNLRHSILSKNYQTEAQFLCSQGSEPLGNKHGGGGGDTGCRRRGMETRPFQSYKDSFI